MDYSSSGSSVHGISQVRILEWITISYSRGIFPTQGTNPCLLHLLYWQAGSLPTGPPGRPPGSRVLGVINICNLKYYTPNSMQSVHTLWRVYVGIMKYMSPASPS